MRSEIPSNRKIISWILYSIFGLFLFITFLSSFYTVKSTERGVLSTFGKIQDKPISDGLHVKIPFIQTIQKVNVHLPVDI